MNVSVQNGDRTEALEQSKRLRTIVGPPAPFLVDHLQRDMRKHDDRRAGRLVLQVGLEPCALLVAVIPESAAFQIDDVAETDEVTAIVVVTLPPRSLRTLSVPLQTCFSALCI